MATWKKDIIEALNNLGGVAPLSKIYSEVEKIRQGNLNPTWDRTIQRELESNSSDSKAFKGEDLFYMAKGKYKGVWGLRSFVPSPKYFLVFQGFLPLRRYQAYSTLVVLFCVYQFQLGLLIHLI